MGRASVRRPDLPPRRGAITPGARHRAGPPRQAQARRPGRCWHAGPGRAVAAASSHPDKGRGAPALAPCPTCAQRHAHVSPFPGRGCHRPGTSIRHGRRHRGRATHEAAPGGSAGPPGTGQAASPVPEGCAPGRRPRPPAVGWHGHTAPSRRARPARPAAKTSRPMWRMSRASSSGWQAKSASQLQKLWSRSVTGASATVAT